MRRLLKVLIWVVACILVPTGGYFGAAFGLATIPINRDFRPDADGVEIAVVSNGIHASLVMPTQVLDVDWSETFPAEHFPIGRSDAPMVMFGWGNRDFYLNTPTWDDFDLLTGVRAVLGVGGSALHVTYLWGLGDGDRVVRFRVSEDAYRHLAAHILGTLALDGDGRQVPIPGYSYLGTDAFFEARGRYSLLATCNEWVRRGLAEAGIRTSVWTPFPAPLLDHLRRP